MNDVAGAPGRPARLRDHNLPVRKSDILDALLAHPALRDGSVRDRFGRFCRLLGAVCHHEYLDDLEKLREAYFYFNPETAPPAHFDDAALERAYMELVGALTATLADANFVEIPHAEVERAHRERPTLKVEIRVPLDDFREVRFFRRGQHQEDFLVRKGWRLRKTPIATDVYDDVILLVAIKPRERLAEKEAARLSRSRIRPGSILIKYFRNVARPDLGTLFPNVRVVMRLLDKVMIGVPALAGGVPIVLKLASTATVLFAVLGFYIGVREAVQNDEIETALAALGAFVALGLFFVRQWVSYQRQSLKYQKALADNFYFRNVNNNAGVFESLAGMAEDQEFKEALLAYFFLFSAEHAMDRPALQARIETWMKSTFRVAIHFDVDDALARLERLEILVRDGRNLSVLAPDEAFVRLDRIWDGYFAMTPRTTS